MIRPEWRKRKSVAAGYFRKTAPFYALVILANQSVLFINVAASAARAEFGMNPATG